ncbi:flagellar biosynthesis protein P [Pseudenhygromyxa sp. WMMC2535]|nr:flagellar biosynthesis protein P [Pseudenhygromyxa sp. WMMC2535]
MGSHEEPALAGDDCPDEGMCTFKKPNVMFVMDYSTSMNEIWDVDNNLSRWQVTVAAVQQITQPGSFLSQNTHLALMRFGHDPAPASEGTTITNETSGIVDGQSLDVQWDDDANEYLPCNGAAIVESLNNTVDPMLGSSVGIGTWTNGAMVAVGEEIAQTKADHPDDGDERAFVNVLLTDGAWTGVDGTTTLSPSTQNPAITTGDLYDNQNIQTFVVAVAGDADAEAAADETAAAGGTTEAIDGATPELLQQALADVVQNIIDSVVAPECVGGLPRIMVLLDASSSMLNISGGTMYGAQGETGWDQARSALSGESSIFDIDVGIGAAEDVTHLGLSVFGHNDPSPGEQKLLVQYGPCMKDNFSWALDPETSCVEPGCSDPWGGPAISWTFQDGSLVDPPGFDQETISHMPKCDGATFCSGSGTYTHLGLQLIKENQATYHADGQLDGATYPTSDATLYFNILITDGQYNGYSTDAQVQAELEEMYDDGIITYVIGFGDGVNTAAAQAQLENMAGWGSGGNSSYYDADNQDALETALAEIFGGLEFDPCCAFNDCSENPEPTTQEPDPVPSDESDDGEEDTTTGDDGETSDGEESTSGDEESGTEDEGDTTTTDEGGETTTDGGDDVGDDGGDDVGDTGDTGGTGGIDEDDGCNCAAADGDADKTRGLLGTFLALGLFGMVRRRRRD